MTNRVLVTMYPSLRSASNGTSAEPHGGAKNKLQRKKKKNPPPTVFSKHKQRSNEATVCVRFGNKQENNG